uniref:CSON005358 protein n=1 Tax=Culicoides sonorensis TaxID=179676 RepID=A0A336LXR8_CULSO
MKHVDYCWCCMSPTAQLILPSKAIAESYFLLLKSQVETSKYKILFCMECCENLQQIITFQEICQNSFESLKNSQAESADHDSFDKINEKLQDLMKENVKTEVIEVVADISGIDYPEGLLDESVSIKTDEQTANIESAMNCDVVTIEEQSTQPIVIKKSVKSGREPKQEHCTLCNESFPSFIPSGAPYTTTFSHHIIIAHSIQKNLRYFCNHCDSNYQKPSSMRKHFRDFHLSTNKKIQCIFCPKIFYQKQKYFEHIKKLHELESKTFICDICGNKSKSKHLINQHMLKCHSQTQCETCNETFNNEKEWLVHRKSCGNKFICHICSKILLTKETLEVHITRMHLPSPPCEMCGQAFDRQMDLDHHMKIEHTTKTKVCDQCGKSFYTDNGLINHVKYTHLKMENLHQKKKFWCRIHNKYESHQTRSAHELREKYGKRYKCDQCGRGFYTNQRLRRHYYQHTKTRPFNCKLCETGYYQKAYLISHYEKIHGSDYLGAIRK